VRTNFDKQAHIRAGYQRNPSPRIIMEADLVVKVFEVAKELAMSAGKVELGLHLLVCNQYFELIYSF